MICCGEFERGELCFLGLGLKLEHKSEYVIFFYSTLFKHFVSNFDENRTSLIFFSYKNFINTEEGV